MNMPRTLKNWVTVFLFAIYLVIPGTSIAAPPEEVPPILQGVSDRLDALEAFVRRLHGNKAALIERDIFLENVDGMVDGVLIKLAFCSGPSEPGPVPGPGCISNNANYEFTTGTLTENDNGAVVTFNADSEPNFVEVVNLLTNGDDDRLNVSVEFLINNSFVAGTGVSGEERSFFFTGLPEAGPQVSSGIGYDDLEGFDIGSISLSLERIYFSYNEIDGKSSVTTRFGVFFELAE